MAQVMQRSFLGASLAAPKRPVSRQVCRAETKPATTDRSKDTLYFASEQSLSYLDGTLPGDYGFDPLGLSDPEGAGGFITPEWLSYAEIMNGRWAMLGVAGCIAPEVLGKAGLVPAETGIAWFQSGVIPLAGSYDYWADPWTIFWVNVVLMHFAELRRWQDFRNPGSMGKEPFLGLEKGLGGTGNPAYPGGPFHDPLGFGKNEKSMADMKVKEVKNGRLAMISMLAYGAQAVLTGKGPFENLLDHLADPVNNNIVTNFAHPFGG